MTEKYYYIYKIINSINNKIYIGKRTSKVPPNKGKVGRGAGFYRWHMENCRNHLSKSQQNIEKHAAEAKRHGEKVRGKQGTTNGKMCIFRFGD